MVLCMDVGRVYGEHPGEQKETEIALSCGMEDGILRWAWVPHANLIPELLQLGAMLWLEIVTNKTKLPGAVRGAGETN